MSNYSPSQFHTNKRVGIALFGKGSTNHLHRTTVVQHFLSEGFQVHFLVRQDYSKLIKRIAGCQYHDIDIVINDSGITGFLRGFLRYFRSLYPACDIAKQYMFRHQNRDRPIVSRTIHFIIAFFARYRRILQILIRVESVLYRNVEVTGLPVDNIDVLCLIGCGGNEVLEAHLGWWGRAKGIPIINVVGNYDNLSTKGFRGLFIDHLLVWGQSMKSDAKALQGIRSNRIHMIGPLRYDHIQSSICLTKAEFFKKCHFDPNIPTIFFGGSRASFHYFEMLSVFQLLSKQRTYQLILRIMPNKVLLNSPTMQAFITHAKSLPNIYVSIGDVHYPHGDQFQEPLSVEEHELWHGLTYSDIVINLYSTLALEACIFDRPVINMWYFEQPDALILKQPIHVPYNVEAHIRRLRSFNCAVEVQTREDLVAAIHNQLENPQRQSDGRRRLVQHECGTLDGKAAQRLVEHCRRAEEIKR